MELPAATAAGTVTDVLGFSLNFPGSPATAGGEGKGAADVAAGSADGAAGGSVMNSGGATGLAMGAGGRAGAGVGAGLATPTGGGAGATGAGGILGRSRTF